MYDIRSEYQYPEIADKTISNYIENRLMAQITWYDGKSAYNQKMYIKLIVLTTILSACIPIFTLLVDMGFDVLFKIIIVTISSSVTVLTGMSSLFNYKETWTQYRLNCEILKSITHRFYTGTGEFLQGSEQENFARLVESCEKYFTSEFDQWYFANNENNKPSKGS